MESVVEIEFLATRDEKREHCFTILREGEFLGKAYLVIGASHGGEQQRSERNEELNFLEGLSFRERFGY
jgi:hypothetical protein